MARPAPFPTAKLLTTAPGVVAMLCCAVTALNGGCRGNAYSDVYRQRMASEVRILEDQLYQADYENRVLQEKLHRAAMRNEQLEAEHVSRQEQQEASPRSPSPRSAPQRDQEIDGFDDDDFDLGDDPDATDSQWRESPDGEARPPVDPGPPIDPETLEPETAPGDGDDATAPRDRRRRDSPLPPAPGGPEPPGEEDLNFPSIDPGELVPPQSPEGEPENPPGQILLPDAVRALSPDGAKTGFPAALSVHPGLSSGHQFEDGEEGLFLIVNVLDAQRRPLNLEAFDAEAPLTVVAVDPEAGPESPRLGRWEFSREEVNQLVRTDPVSGLQIPIRWKDRRPTGDHVVVHVRMKNEQQEIRCEAKLSVKPAAAVAEWTPRGASKKR